MSTMDPAKLKVVELRAELQSRGLDTKGNKPVLVKRLKDALEKELEKEIPDTSIADTSTEDLNTSQESVVDDVQCDPPDKEADAPGDTDKEREEPSKIEEVENPEENQQLPPEPEIPNENASSESSKEEAQPKEDDCVEDVTEKLETQALENDGAQEIQDSDSPTKMETQEIIEAPTEDGAEAKTVPEEPKGEKRRRSSPSPDRVQRKRSKSPIKEDEPVIDNNKVQLSWYDSDLHLHIDKKSFLSGKPYHEGAFGYAWAGVRATHGIKSGKVYFEVKVTEELKWEDLVKQHDKKRDGSKRDRSKVAKAAPEKESCESVKSSEDAQKEGEEKCENGKEEGGEKMEEGVELAAESAETKESPVEVAEAEKEEKVEKVEEAELPSCENGDKEAKKENKQEAMEVDEVPVEPIAKHLFRIGWSVADSGLQLGEVACSYGFESSGRFVCNKEFVDYGIKYGVGDVVSAYLNIGDEFVSFTFAVNGELQQEAACIPRVDFPAEGFALFPHILTRNYAFEVNLGGQEEPWFALPADVQDYLHMEAIEDKVPGPRRPESRSDCEVIMMCGLPASGKTYWVREMIDKNPDKRYTVIGNSHLLDKMTVNGNPLKNSYKGRWNIILDRLLKCVNVLVETAALRRRNYVIDQTNVFPSAQRRKMRLFEGFKRRAVVVVVADEEQAKRRAQQEAQDGKDVPDSAILEMKANMSLPRRGDWMDEVSYVELNEDEAKALVQKYNQQGREAGFGPMVNQRGNYRDNRGHPYRWDHSTSRRDYRGGYRDNRSYQNNRYDRSRQHGWQNRRPPPGSWNRDIRREGRGPPAGSREFRNSNNRSSGGGRQQERSGGRDGRNRNQNSGNYNRNQRSQNNRNQLQNWQGGSGGGGGGSWQNQNWGGQGMWNQGSWGQGGWSGQQQWKGNYSQSGYGQGYSGYANWNYYGQYPQNWNSQNNVG